MGRRIQEVIIIQLTCTIYHTDSAYPQAERVMNYALIDGCVRTVL